MDDLENDSSLLGMPTVAQLADLEAAILLHKAILWPTVEFMMVEENGTGAPLDAADSSSDTRTANCATGGTCGNPRSAPSDEMLEHFNEWFDANIGFNANVVVAGGLDEPRINQQQVAAPEFQWQQPDIQAAIIEEPEFAADDLNIADEHMPAFNAFLDDYFANVHK
ncbi:hypothetical protein HDU80_003548 [Chytriomyces hyalinus]|nr:hypothetical protein HDU80_003548 [Chytriomyces hyalinus]